MTEISFLDEFNKLYRYSKLPEYVNVIVFFDSGIFFVDHVVLLPLLLTLNKSQKTFSVSVVNFEQVNVFRDSTSEA